MQGVSIGVRAKFGVGFTSDFWVGSTLEFRVGFCVEFDQNCAWGLLMDSSRVWCGV